MASLYVHIPFCREACHYCDFHFSVDLRLKERMVRAILKEMELRKDFFEKPGLDTLYLGGGTPSVLDPEQIHNIIATATALFGAHEAIEITMEVNPDDLHRDYLESLSNAGVNRLSIGVQSFHDDDLKLMNRRHDAARALECIQLSRLCGFRNISIDLIYGLPGLDLEKWKDNLAIFFSLNLPHLSAYHLGFEPRTVLYQRLTKNRITEPSEQDSLDQFEWLMDACEGHNYEHYEISNFARKGWYSKHNRVYWCMDPFLGVGPSAHSFTGHARQWNPPMNQSYIAQLDMGNLFYREEAPGMEIGLHDYILSAIRTQWGLDLVLIRKNFGAQAEKKILGKAKKFLDNGELILEENHICLSRSGKFVSDYITRALF